jgi:hypothetical protein
MKLLLAGTAILLSALLTGCQEKSVSAEVPFQVPEPGGARRLEFDQRISDTSNDGIPYRASGYVLYTLSADNAAPLNQREVSLSISGSVFDERWGSPVGRSVQEKRLEEVTVQANTPAVFTVEFPVEQMSGGYSLVVDFAIDGRTLAIQKMYLSNIRNG